MAQIGGGLNPGGPVFEAEKSNPMLQALVLDEDFQAIGVIDAFISFIWTERYWAAGDFEIVAPTSTELIDLCQLGRYLYLTGSDYTMVIETVKIESNIDTGSKMTISGRSFESVMDRRVIWGYRTFEDVSVYNVIRTLLRENLTNGSLAGDDRRTGLNFNILAAYPSTAGKVMSAQYLGENLYDVICAICQERGLGFRVAIRSYTSAGKGVQQFELYEGTDRSYDQLTVPYVIFSPKYGNLLSSEYLETNTIHKTAVLIGGDGEGAEKRLASYTTGKTKLARREIYVEASGISTSDEDGNPLSDAAIEEQMIQKGKEALAELDEEEVFEGEIEMTNQFVYGVDFFLGDIVQIRNEYGKEARARVTEIMRSVDTDGIHTVPTFVKVEPKLL